MSESPRTPPPLWVERFLTDTLSEAERDAFMRMTSEAERARLRSEHEALQARLVQERKPADFARSVSARAERERATARTTLQPWLARGALFASLTLVGAWVARDALLRLDASEQRADSAYHDVERAKGLAPSLRVYRKRAEGPELLAQGQRVAPGDLVQLGYVAPGMRHAVLLSIDGRGQVTLHFPSAVDASTALEGAQGERLLPTAYELDDAPGFERFVLVSSPRALRAAEVLRAARALVRRGGAARDAPLALPAPAGQVSVLLDKGGP